VTFKILDNEFIFHRSESSKDLGAEDFLQVELTVKFPGCVIVVFGGALVYSMRRADN